MVEPLGRTLTQDDFGLAIDLDAVESGGGTSLVDRLDGHRPRCGGDPEGNGEKARNALQVGNPASGYQA